MRERASERGSEGASKLMSSEHCSLRRINRWGTPTPSRMAWDHGLEGRVLTLP